MPPEARAEAAGRDEGEGALVADVDRALDGAEGAGGDGPRERFVLAGVGGDADLAGADGVEEGLDDTGGEERLEGAGVEMRDVEDEYRRMSRELTLEEWEQQPLRSTVLDNLARLTAAVQ